MKEKLYREALYRAAPSHQGGHSATGACIAEALGVPFPLSVSSLEDHAKREGFNPDYLWPWLKNVRSGAVG